MPESMVCRVDPLQRVTWPTHCDPMIILCTDGKFIDQLHGMFHEHLSRPTRTVLPKAIASESSLVLIMGALCSTLNSSTTDGVEENGRLSAAAQGPAPVIRERGLVPHGLGSTPSAGSPRRRIPPVFSDSPEWPSRLS